MARSRILVTGGAGFIGSHLVERLVRDGHAVRVLDNLLTGKLSNLAGVLGEIEFVRGDVRDLETVRKAVAGVDVIFHLAALSSVPRSVADPLAAHEINATGTLNVLVAARDAEVRRVVYASSASVYGDSSELPKREGMRPEPLSTYAVTKLAGELYLKVFCHRHGLEGVSLRYFNVFGPRQDPSSPYSGVIPRFVRALQAGEAPVVFGDGDQSRDFVFVDDVVEANLLAAVCPRARGEPINVGTGLGVTINDLAHRLQVLMGRPIPPCHAPPRDGDVRHSVADLARAEAILGYRPSVELDEGLRRTVEWFATC